jgi:LmbE family N-acetylglucosaminyl deacetylase
MFTNATILAVGAHPDDLEYGCLGTLLKYGKPKKVVTYVASMGTRGDPTATPARVAESRKALKVVDVVETRYREKVGVQLDDYAEVVSELEDLLRAYSFTLILTHGRKDSHQEHRLLFEMVITAARHGASSILTYGILSNTPDFCPNIFVDISGQYQTKLTALACHESQRHKHYMSPDYIQAFHSRSYASLHGKPYVECFEIFRLFA